MKTIRLYGKISLLRSLKKGHNYLNPDIDIIADDTLDEEYKVKLERFFKRLVFTSHY